MTDLKTCPICKQDKPLDAYYVRRRPARAGVAYQHGCKACRKSQTLDWQASHPERTRAIGQRASLRYYRANKATIAKRQKARIAKDPDAARAAGRARYAARKAAKLAKIAEAA